MDDNKELDNINSMACEEFNYWLSGFKHNVKHMNYIRLNFFYSIIFDIQNKYQLRLNKENSNN